jgi:hypothetical protein
MSLCETHRGETLLSLNISAGYPGKQDVLRDVALDVAEG